MQSHEVHRLFWHQLVEGLAWTTVAPVDVVERGEDRDLVPVKVQRPGPGGGLGLAGEFPRREGDDMVCAGSRLVGGAEREAEGGVSARARAGGCLVAALRTQREPQLPSEQRAPGQLRGWLRRTRRRRGWWRPPQTRGIERIFKIPSEAIVDLDGQASGPGALGVYLDR